MEIPAAVVNGLIGNTLTVKTSGMSLAIPAKGNGRGPSVTVGNFCRTGLIVFSVNPAVKQNQTRRGFCKLGGASKLSSV
jgi:hypothetical protein